MAASSRRVGSGWRGFLSRGSYAWGTRRRIHGDHERSATWATPHPVAAGCPRKGARSARARRCGRRPRGRRGRLPRAATGQPQPRRAGVPQPGRGDPPRAAHLRRRHLRAGLPPIPHRRGRRPGRVQVPAAVARVAGPVRSGHRRPPARAGDRGDGRRRSAVAARSRAERQRMDRNGHGGRRGAVPGLRRPQRHGARIPSDRSAGRRVPRLGAARGAYRVTLVVRDCRPVPRSLGVPPPVRRGPGGRACRSLARGAVRPHPRLARPRHRRAGRRAVRRGLAGLQRDGDGGCAHPGVCGRRAQRHVRLRPTSELGGHRCDVRRRGGRLHTGQRRPDRGDVRGGHAPVDRRRSRDAGVRRRRDGARPA